VHAGKPQLAIRDRGRGSDIGHRYGKEGVMKERKERRMRNPEAGKMGSKWC
jgi:hypothetical protein